MHHLRWAWPFAAMCLNSWFRLSNCTLHTVHSRPCSAAAASSAFRLSFLLFGFLSRLPVSCSSVALAACWAASSGFACTGSAICSSSPGPLPDSSPVAAPWLSSSLTAALSRAGPVICSVGTASAGSGRGGSASAAGCKGVPLSPRAWALLPPFPFGRLTLACACSMRASMASSSKLPSESLSSSRSLLPGSSSLLLLLCAPGASPLSSAGPAAAAGAPLS